MKYREIADRVEKWLVENLAVLFVWFFFPFMALVTVFLAVVLVARGLR